MPLKYHRLKKAAARCVTLRGERGEDVSLCGVASTPSTAAGLHCDCTTCSTCATTTQYCMYVW